MLDDKKYEAIIYIFYSEIVVHFLVFLYQYGFFKIKVKLFHLAGKYIHIKSFELIWI